MNKSLIDNNLSLKLLEQVQALNADHASAIALLEKECFSLPWSEKHIKQVLSHQAFQVLGIKNYANKELAAYISFYHLSDEMEIINIATRPEYRRKNLASTLLRATIDKGLSHGATRILLEVRETNQPAINLYQNFGFNPIAIRKAYYHDTNEDAILFELKLTSR